MESFLEGNNGHVVDIDNWAVSLSKILEDVPDYMCRPGHPGRITRIPENIRDVDKKAYEPYFMSIGPYHQGKTRVERMEMRKRVVLKQFLQHKPALTLKYYLIEMKSIEPAARSFYSDVDMESKKFVEMLLLDTVYVITVFCGMPQSTNRRIDCNETDGSADRMNNGILTDEDNQRLQEVPVPDNESCSEENMMPRWFSTLFVHDLFLLENQLPFFVLRKMYNFAYNYPETQLISSIKDTIGDMLSDYTKLDLEMVISPAEEVHHLLHICHLFFRPTIKHESTARQLNESNQMFRLGSAVQLYETGVRFVSICGSTQHSLLDITFGTSGKMCMPCLHVDDNTVSLLRNLIALEQMKYPSLGLHVSAYAVLLLHLVTTPEDVKLLRRKGIIQHHLASDKEMMLVVNRLSIGLAFDYVEDDYSLKPVLRDLKSYSERRLPRWRAWFQHRYFSNPWTAISLAAASLLLLLTVVQTFYTVYSFYYPYLDYHP